MFDQLATRLHQTLLHAGQGFLLDPTREIPRSASPDELHSTGGKSELRDPVKYMLVNRLPLIWRRKLPESQLTFTYVARGAGKLLNQLALSARPNVGGAAE